ncbi:hypothetical protein EUGRSUZ_J02777 [Eucalyptus grandis]|uniref:Uncharacterized protein n=2 Tax=Eucalyptus grandis TaxID=71139 RepID=A0ACC3JAN7_EUCGR|nr:hypothetical protein EUGRSUZ_J02777 [Eucalyptus grandis]
MQKFWVDEKPHNNCLLVLPKAMYLEGGDRNLLVIQFSWQCRCSVPELLKLSWLYIKGRFHANALSPKTMYEIAFVIKLRRSCTPWPLPVDLELHLPDGSKVISTESPAKKPKEEWIKLHIGKFATDAKNVGEIYSSLRETCQIDKSGLVLKGLRVDSKG